MDKIKFAIAGCGHIGKRHAAMIEQCADAEVVALCDVQPVESLFETMPRVPFFQSYDALLKSDLEIDVINICTPNGFHAEHAVKALQNRKHVVVEKPMALRKKDCVTMIADANKIQKHIFCVMQNRFSPPSVWIKNIIENKLLGNIYLVQVNCFWNRDARYYHNATWHGKKSLDGGTLFTQFSHFIDTMLWLFGDIENINARFADFNHSGLSEFEDSGIVHFNFMNGALGTINYSTSVYDKNFESSLKIIGEHGTVEIGGQYMNEVKYCNIKDYTIPILEPTSDANNYGAYQGSASNHHFIIQNVVDVLQNKGIIATTAEEGMLVVDVIERIYTLRPDFTQ